MPPRTRPTTSDHLTKAAADTGDLFSWEGPDGGVIVLPAMKSLPTKILRENRNRDDLDFMFTLLETLLPPKDLAVIDALPLNQTNDLFQEWQKTAAVTIPQS